MRFVLLTASYPLLIETVFGPVWVWLALDEQVPAMTLLGGTIILATITVHSILALRNSRPVSAQQG